MRSSNVISIVLAFVFVIHLHLVPSSHSKTSPVAIHPERNKLLEDALSWLTLRSDGKLLTPVQSAPFLEALRKEYRSSRLYRAFVISFQQGILPKLTLEQGEICEPFYKDRDKNKFNDTVTWWNIKLITLLNYDLETGAFCNFTKGLQCNSTTKKCECPEGSKMGPIEENSQIQRCQLEENQPCALADLAMSTRHEKMAGKLHEIIFNLEKPLSCKWGTQCRFKGSHSRYTKCSKPPFDSNIPDLMYGEECVLDYVGDNGGCRVESLYKGPICYNFWGYLKSKKFLSSGVDRRKGFCALDMAPYVTPGITFLQEVGATILHTDYFLTAFVNPRTVSMPSADLINYDKELHKVSDDYRLNRYENDEGKPCSVADTQKLKDIWKFYQSLEGDSTTGQDFVADVATLKAKLDEYKNLIGKKDQPKICRIVFERGNGTSNFPLNCESTGSQPDTEGNDGKCVLLKDSNEILHLQEHSDKQWQFYQYNQLSRDDYHNPDDHYEPEILENNPEKQCIQTHIKSVIRSTNARMGDEEDDGDDDDKLPRRGDVLEDGSCQDNRYFCFEDLSDSYNIYDNSLGDCKFISGYQAEYACLDVLSDTKKLEECEDEVLRKRSKAAFETVAKLGYGAACNYQTELDISKYVSESGKGMKDINGYRVLMYLKVHGICDSSKLLECSAGNTCDCIENTEVRKSADGMHTSEYCYLTSGPCNTDITQLVSLKPGEVVAARLHYGDPQSVGTGCSNGNICKFIDPESDECTDTNTGKTGVDVQPTTTRPPRPEPPPPTRPPGPGPPPPIRPPGPGPPPPTRPPGPGPPPPTRPPGPGPAPSPRPVWTPRPNIGRPLEPVVPYSGSEMTLKKQTYMSLVISMIIVIFSSLLQ